MPTALPLTVFPSTAGWSPSIWMPVPKPVTRFRVTWLPSPTVAIPVELEGAPPISFWAIRLRAPIAPNPPVTPVRMFRLSTLSLPGMVPPPPPSIRLPEKTLPSLLERKMESNATRCR